MLPDQDFGNDFHRLLEILSFIASITVHKVMQWFHKTRHVQGYVNGLVDRS